MSFCEGDLGVWEIWVRGEATGSRINCSNVTIGSDWPGKKRKIRIKIGRVDFIGVKQLKVIK